MAVKIMGLDLSLTSPGMADANEALSIKVPAKLRGPERLDYLRGLVLDRALSHDLIVIEGYSMGSRSSAVTGLAELGGVIRLSLWRKRIPYTDVAPTRLKKFATGRGNADKESVLIQAVRKADVAIDDNDAADAWWLRQMALVHYGLPGAVKVNNVQRSALKEVAWPTLDEAVPA